jgi:phospholipid/cholesterol/gamma-HCH transport system ATP-binding protein
MSEPESQRERPAAEAGRPASAENSSAPNPRPLIEVRDLEVTFDAQTVLQDIDLTIGAGESVAVIGESGCGKTVFMKTLVGLVRPSRGAVSFDGHDLARLSPAALSDLRRRFGFVFQNAALFDSMTVFDNVAFPMRQSTDAGSEEIRRRVIQHIQEVGLPVSVVSKRPSELSGGMRKRIGLARAIILEPELVVYDEPTTGLDPIMSDVINELMLEIRRRYPVTSVIVTHDMRTAHKVADRVLMFYPRTRLAAGESQILYDGPPQDLEAAAADRRVRQFVRGEAGDRLKEMAS